MRGRRLAVAAVTTALLVWVMRTCPAPRPLYPVQEPAPPTAPGPPFPPAGRVPFLPFPF